MTRTVDEKWKDVQKETMVKWANSVIRIHDKSLQIQNLETDLKDTLIALLDNLSERQGIGDRVRVRNRNPRMLAHVRENLAACFNYLESQNIKVVNIGMSLDLNCIQKSQHNTQ